MMDISLEFLFESFLAGLGLILSSRGLLFILLTIVLCLIGVFLRSRGPARLALALILLVCILHLHVFELFPYDRAANTLMSLSSQSGSTLDRITVIIAKTAYNFGLVFIPFVIYAFSLSLTGQPALEDY